MNFIELLTVITRNRKLFIYNFLFFSILVAVYSLCAPKWYSAKTTILPPEGDATMNLTSIIRSLPSNIGNLALGGVTTEANIFIAILKSRTLQESVAEQFDLKSIYSTENMEETVRALNSHVNIEINDDGTISLSMESGTKYFSGGEEENEARSLARDVANYFIIELDRLNKGIRTKQAKNRRLFIEERYLQNLADLAIAENKLREFQKETGMIALSEQIEAAIMAAAKLKAEIVTKEVDLEVLNKYLNTKHSDLVRVGHELDALRTKYQEVIGGQVNRGKDNLKKRGIDPFIAFN